LGACGSSSPKAGSTTSTTATTSINGAGGTSTTTSASSSSSTGPSLQEIQASPTVIVAGKKVDVPSDGGKPINPDIDDGQQVIISAHGFLPARLYSTPAEALVWTNLTNQDQQVIFDHFAVKSPLIPPGGTFSWTSQASESISYHSASGMHAVVVINPPGV
jgi:hypothetical protein